MHSWRWGGSILLLIGVVALVQARRWHSPERVVAAPPSEGLNITGVLEYPGSDPRRLMALCSVMRLEEGPRHHRAELDSQGGFVFRGLTDTDYYVEILTRSEPVLVVAAQAYVRPGRPLVLVADPLPAPASEASRALAAE